jgi:hypothetical protein
VKKQTWQQWARACAKDPSSPSSLREGALAALTGQDTRALDAIVACLELYSNSDDAGRQSAEEAIQTLLLAMQANTRWVARELIPFVFDWNDRDRLWARFSFSDAVFDGEGCRNDEEMLFG